MEDYGLGMPLVIAANARQRKSTKHQPQKAFPPPVRQKVSYKRVNYLLCQHSKDRKRDGTCRGHAEEDGQKPPTRNTKEEAYVTYLEEEGER